MDLLALCLAAICILYVNAYKEMSKTGLYPSSLDIACKQLTSSSCPVHVNWISRCPRQMKTTGGVAHSESFKIKLHKERKTWDEALKVCQSNGGILAMPKTKEKQKVLKKRQTFGDEVWIGLKDVDGNNSYQWIDGESLTYNNWCHGEPNYRNERCVSDVVSFGRWNGWHDLRCELKRHFICQY